MAAAVPARSKKTTDRRERYDRFLREVSLGNGMRLKVGWIGPRKKRRKGKGGSKVTVVEVAAAHEFGAPKAGIPQRSTLRATADRKRSRYAVRTTRIANAVVDGRQTVKGGLDELGREITGDVQQAIVALKSPPLKPATIRRKAKKVRNKGRRAKFSASGGNPLVDTSQMMNSVTHKVSKVGARTKGRAVRVG